MKLTPEKAWELMQLYLDSRIPKEIRSLDLDLSREIAAEEALLEISRNPMMALDVFPAAVVRVIFEKILMSMAILAMPGFCFSYDFDKCTNELEQLSLLLWGEIRQMKLRDLSLYQAPPGRCQ